ncbi:MAG: DUF2330 domain-containing protein [Candidatus Altiarchaeota archaeon]|nr:DUF2330 domain-containing protein [Candidatus Altiarchaeota archaeon]
MNRIWVTLLIVFLISNNVCSDGGFFPPVYYNEDIYEPSQKAAIIHDGVNEQLILQVTYEGNTTEFAWIVPTPSYPDVEKAKALLFEELHWLTEPEYKRAPGFGFTTMDGVMRAQEAVTVHEQKQVGVYEIAILSSDDPKALINWLNANGYRITSAAEEVIGYYVEKRWFFTAVRLNMNPSNEKLLNSLRNIVSDLENQEDASEKLTQYLVDAVKNEKLYSDLPALSDAYLDYGSVDTEPDTPYPGAFRSEPYYMSNRPEQLITGPDYTSLYQRYNGYLLENMKEQIRYKIKSNLDKKVSFPSQYECYAKHSYSDEECGLWYFTEADKEYNAIAPKDSRPYKQDELSEIAAEKAYAGDREMIDFFNLKTEKPEWHYNRADMIEYLKRQVDTQLSETLYMRRIKKENGLKAELVNGFSRQMGVGFRDLNYLTDYLVDMAYNELVEDIVWSDSMSKAFDVLDYNQYSQLKKLYDGDHDETVLRKALKTKVDDVLYWNLRNTARRLNAGTIQPLKLSFKSENAIYPLKISSVNKGATEILLYVFAKHKVSEEGFATEYARWVETDDVKHYEVLNEVLDNRYYLTKLRREMWPKEMTEDLILEKAQDNSEVIHVVYEDGYYLGWAITFFSIFILYLMILFINTPPTIALYLLSKRLSLGVFNPNPIKHLLSGSFIPLYLLSAVTLGDSPLIEVSSRILSSVFDFMAKALNLIGFPEVLIMLFFILLIPISAFWITYAVLSCCEYTIRKFQKKALTKA